MALMAWEAAALMADGGGVDGVEAAAALMALMAAALMAWRRRR